MLVEWSRDVVGYDDGREISERRGGVMRGPSCGLVASRERTNVYYGKKNQA